MIPKCKNLTRWLSLPTLSSLAAAQPGSSEQQLIPSNYKYFLFAFVKLKHYFLLIKQCITLKSDIILFWHCILKNVLYTLFVLSCPTKLTGLYCTVSTLSPCSSKFTLLIWTKIACWEHLTWIHTANIYGVICTAT